MPYDIPQMDFHPKCTSVLLTSTRLTLTYHRSRAPNVLAALLAFFHSEKSMLARQFRLGWHQHTQLTRLELSCAQAGLIFPSANTKINPWVLPDDLNNRSLKDLPHHPLVDPSFLSELLDKESSAQSAIYQLLIPESLNDRWNNIPIINFEQPINSNARVAVCLHLFYPELWPTLRDQLAFIPEPWDLYISVPNFACTKELAKIAHEHPSIHFLPCINRGRDVLPFIYFLNQGVFEHYDVVCKLHTKRSPNTQKGAKWFMQILQSLLGNKKNTEILLEKIRNNPDIGLVGSKEQLINIDNPLHQGCNQKNLNIILERASLNNELVNRPFFAGTMFWFRPSALNGLRKLKLTVNDFPLEMGQNDGTIAHALERLLWPLIENEGYVAIKN